ncbi:hypothetical protein AGMMS50262_01790 [Bacteroidia bacterium]|nr:hypothetical protein AGMMS50262_01790 [Bacteroidia bacterium]
MCVAPQPSAGLSDTAVLYIPDAVAVAGNSSILQNGVTAVGGNFYQGASTPAFSLDAAGNFTIGTGKVRFKTDSNPAEKREIAVWNNPNSYYNLNGTDFSRKIHYVAFPNVELATNDTVYVANTFGLDANNLTRPANPAVSGVLYLESNPVGTQVYDASFRVTGTNVTAGAVVVEKYVLPYRNPNKNTAYLFPFASPYINQKAGYFAGNWVRTPVTDANGSTAYPYANQKSSNGDFIAENQYVRGANDLLNAVQPYLLKLQPAGYTYENSGDFQGFTVTGGNDHDLPKFVFDGTPYNIAYTAEQKFTGSNLYSRTPATTGTTLNWLIGNSYTGALSGDSLVRLIEDSGITFSSLVYVYPHGATTYETYDIAQGATLPDIPAMSIFMVRVSNKNMETGKAFTIPATFQVHTDSTSTVNEGDGGPFKISTSTIASLELRLTPAANPFIYDRSRIYLREDANVETDKYDIVKMENPGNQYFTIYTQAGTSHLQNNALPVETVSVPVSVSPARDTMECRLTVSGEVETEKLLLHDTKLNVWTDLLEIPEYVFTTQPADNSERFVLYFKSPTGIDEVSTTAIYGYYSDGIFHLNRLQPADEGSNLKIYNASGILVVETTVTGSPHYQTAVRGAQGVYIARLEGSASVQTFKFVRK